jgi:hypothetical protein
MGAPEASDPRHWRTERCTRPAQRDAVAGSTRTDGSARIIRSESAIAKQRIVDYVPNVWLSRSPDVRSP